MIIIWVAVSCSLAVTTYAAFAIHQAEDTFHVNPFPFIIPEIPDLVLDFAFD